MQWTVTNQKMAFFQPIRSRIKFNSGFSPALGTGWPPLAPVVFFTRLVSVTSFYFEVWLVHHIFPCCYKHPDRNCLILVSPQSREKKKPAPSMHKSVRSSSILPSSRFGAVLKGQLLKSNEHWLFPGRPLLLYAPCQETFLSIYFFVWNFSTLTDA